MPLKEIMTHFRKTYLRNKNLNDNLEIQESINLRMRSILFNWIFEIHTKFTLKTKTLFITANIFNRYLSYE